MVAYSSIEFQRLSEHMSSKPKGNMHRRQKRTISGKSMLWYSNILKLASKGRIHGHIFGVGVDFEYAILQTTAGAVFQLLRNASSRTEAMEILTKEPARILARIATDKGDNKFSNYAEGEFYVKRSPFDSESDALREAVALGIVPLSAKANLLAWNFTIVKGKKKRKKKVA